LLVWFLATRRERREEAHRRAVEPPDKGYWGSPVGTVPDDDWVNVFAAAEVLGVSTVGMGSLIRRGRVTPVHNAAGQAGVSRASFEQERRRRTAGLAHRVRLYLSDAFRSLWSRLLDGP
jgi:hypothetical protein